MAVSWTSEEIINFIDLYRKEPCIWNPNHLHHKDKKKVKLAWDRIAHAVGSSVEEVKRKKEILMASFRLNHRKVLVSQKSAASSEDIYKPIWQYYDVMASFLSDIYQCKTVAPTEECVEEILLVDRSPPASPEVGYEDFESETEETSQTAPLVSNSVQKRPHSNLLECSEELKIALSALNKVLCDKLKSKSEDDCDLYGRLLAKKLRQYSDSDRQELMYEIDGLLLKKRQSLEHQ